MNVFDSLDHATEWVGAFGLVAGAALVGLAVAAYAAFRSWAQGARLRRVTARYVELQSAAGRRQRADRRESGTVTRQPV